MNAKEGRQYNRALEASRRWKKAHPEAVKAHDLKYRRNKPEKARAAFKRWSKTEKGKMSRREKEKRRRLRDPEWALFMDVKRQLQQSMGIPMGAVPKELVEAKVAHIKVKRLIKTIKKHEQEQNH